MLILSSVFDTRIMRPSLSRRKDANSQPPSMVSISTAKSYQEGRMLILSAAGEG